MCKLLLVLFTVIWTVNCCTYTVSSCLDVLQTALLIVGNNCTKDNGTRVQFWVYTTSGSTKLNSATEVNTTKPMKILLHGWGGNKDIHYIKVITDAYLARYGSSRTIIVIDYSMYAPDGNLLTYATAFCNAPAVGISVGQFLCNLMNNGVSPNNIHVVGHSLGAQIAGIAGRYTQYNCNKTVNRITGLDPAGVGYNCLISNDCSLDKSDATFVDVIHTNMGVYGTALTSGDVDFYANYGGPLQPGCVENFTNATAAIANPTMTISCSHQRSCYLFAESIILNSFQAIECVLFLLCFGSSNVYMGEYCDPNPPYSMYLVETNAMSPYGEGPNGPL